MGARAQGPAIAVFDVIDLCDDVQILVPTSYVQRPNSSSKGVSGSQTHSHSQVLYFHPLKTTSPYHREGWMSNTLDHWLINVATLFLNFHTFAIVCCSIRNEVNRDLHQVTPIIWLVLKGSNG